MKPLPRVKGAYYQAKAEEWIYPVADRYRMACCECGLVHEMDFRPINKSRVRFRVRLNKRATAAIRYAMAKR